MNEVKITLLEDRVLVEQATPEEITKGGVIIPDSVQEKPQQGVVVAVGCGKNDKPLKVKLGDNVLFGKYAGTVINIQGNDYLLMKEADIFAII